MRSYIQAPLKLSVGKKKMRGLTIKAPEQEEEEEEEEVVTMTSVKKSVEQSTVVEAVKEAHKEESQKEEGGEEKEEEEEEEKAVTMTGLKKEEEKQQPVFAVYNFDETEGEATTDQRSQFASASQTAETGLRELRAKIDGSYANHPNVWGARTELVRLEEEYDSAQEWFDCEFARPDYALEKMTLLAAQVGPENIDGTLERLLKQGKHEIGDVRTVNTDISKRMLVVMEAVMSGKGGTVTEANEIAKELDSADKLVYERDRPIIGERMKQLGEHKGASAISAILKGLEPMLGAADGLASSKETEGYQAANRSLAWIAKMCEELLVIANQAA